MVFPLRYIPIIHIAFAESGSRLNSIQNNVIILKQIMVDVFVEIDANIDGDVDDGDGEDCLV